MESNNINRLRPIMGYLPHYTQNCNPVISTGYVTRPTWREKVENQKFEKAYLIVEIFRRPSRKKLSQPECSKYVEILGKKGVSNRGSF